MKEDSMIDVLEVADSTVDLVDRKLEEIGICLDVTQADMLREVLQEILEEVQDC